MSGVTYAHIPPLAVGAKHRFALNQRVRLSAAGRRHKIEMPQSAWGTTGVIVGFGRMPDEIRVLADGAKTPITFHQRFWEPRS